MASQSYTKINYSTRIAKAIERKMFCEVFRKLSVFKKLSSYKYIGFGSTFFSDFSLFHKILSINDMVSIEKEIDDKGRFVFNKPYSCIDLKFDSSNNILPTLPWNSPTILWLDYDDHLTSECLNDIQTFFSSACSGSFFSISINAHADNGNGATQEEINQFRKNKLIERIGSSKVPRGLTNQHFTHKRFPEIYHQVIKTEISEILTNRNGVLPKKERFSFLQILNFEYQDGAKMLTVGGILYQEKDLGLVKAANFKELDFFRNGDERFKIEIPSLTLKEIRYLDSMLPSKINAKGALSNRKKDIACIPQDDILKYKKLYRHFPTFAEAII